MTLSLLAAASSSVGQQRDTCKAELCAARSSSARPSRREAVAIRQQAMAERWYSNYSEAQVLFVRSRLPGTEKTIG